MRKWVYSSLCLCLGGCGSIFQMNEANVYSSQQNMSVKEVVEHYLKSKYPDDTFDITFVSGGDFSAKRDYVSVYSQKIDETFRVIVDHVKNQLVLTDSYIAMTYKKEFEQPMHDMMTAYDIPYYVVLDKLYYPYYDSSKLSIDTPFAQVKKLIDDSVVLSMHVFVIENTLDKNNVDTIIQRMKQVYGRADLYVYTLNAEQFEKLVSGNGSDTVYQWAYSDIWGGYNDRHE